MKNFSPPNCDTEEYNWSTGKLPRSAVCSFHGTRQPSSKYEPSYPLFWCLLRQNCSLVITKRRLRPFIFHLICTVVKHIYPLYTFYRFKAETPPCGSVKWRTNNRTRELILIYGACSFHRGASPGQMQAFAESKMETKIKYRCC